MKMETGIQRVFKKRFDNTFQEYHIHMIHIIDFQGNRTTKHDKTLVGGIYRVAKPSEHSIHGEVLYHDPDDGQEKRLIKIS